MTQSTLNAASTDSVAREYSAPPAGTSKQWFERGLLADRANQPILAARDYRFALALDTLNTDALNNLGFSLGKLGFFLEALPPLEKVTRLRPDFVLARNNLAWVKSQVPGDNFKRAFVLQNTGRADSAVVIYRQLLTEAPNWVNAHYNLGYALLTMGNCREAVDQFEKTLQLNPDFTVARLHLSTCYAKLGRPSDAAREKAIYDKASAAVAASK
jgi:tetratricopeptide (TPR) repeat protein